MKFLTQIRKRPVITPTEAAKYINVNQIANSIEKVNATLTICRQIGNEEAIATWERILASLQCRWREAVVEVESNGKYSYQ